MAKSKKTAKSKPASPPVTTDLTVHYDTRTWVSRPRNTDDEWDRDDTCSEHTLHNVSITKPGDYPTLTYPGEVNPGDKVYVLFAVYSTGDSFGHDESRCIEFISVHKDLNCAQYNYKMLQGTNDNDYSSQITLSQDNGVTWVMSPPWCGYFERLTYLKVGGFTVRGADEMIERDGRYESWYDEYN